MFVLTYLGFELFLNSEGPILGWSAVSMPNFQALRFFNSNCFKINQFCILPQRSSNFKTSTNFVNNFGDTKNNYYIFMDLLDCVAWLIVDIVGILLEFMQQSQETLTSTTSGGLYTIHSNLRKIILQDAREEIYITKHEKNKIHFLTFLLKRNNPFELRN